MEYVSAPELAAWLNDTARPRPVLLDVRENWEFETCHINGSVLIPMNTIPGRIDDLDDDAQIVCICHHGARSMQVAHFLQGHGFEHLANIAGGIHAWSAELDPSIARY